MKHYIISIAFIIISVVIGYKIWHLNGSIFVMKKGMTYGKSFVNSQKSRINTTFENAKYGINDAKNDMQAVENIQKILRDEIERIHIEFIQYENMNLTNQ